MLTPSPIPVSVETCSSFCNRCCWGREGNMNETDTAAKVRLAHHNNYICVWWVNFMGVEACTGIHNPVFFHTHFSWLSFLIEIHSGSVCASFWVLITDVVFSHCLHQACVLVSWCMVRLPHFKIMELSNDVSFGRDNAHI
jgi:hypothetical protein